MAKSASDEEAQARIKELRKLCNLVTKGKEERDKQSLLKAAYIALKSEIETNKEFYECGVGKILEGPKSDEPLYQRSVFDFEHNTIYFEKINWFRLIC